MLAHVLLALLLPIAAEPPAQLACLARHYRLTPASEAGMWVGILPDGRRLAFDDGKSKTFDERLAAPDLKDIFAIPYRAGAIRPVEAADEDPGRVRVTALFDATYGNGRALAAKQARVRFLGRPVRLHRNVVPALERVADRLQRARRSDPGLAPFLRRFSGGFANRDIAGTDRKSAHAWGLALDLDPSMSNYWRWDKPLRWRSRIPQAIVDAFESEGFIWGGRWYHYDTMHFEYRPELIDPACGAPSGSVPDNRSR